MAIDDQLNQTESCRSCFWVLKTVLGASVALAIGIMLYALVFGIQDMRQQFFANQVIIYDCDNSGELLLEKTNDLKVIFLTLTGTEILLNKTESEQIYQAEDMILEILDNQILLSQDGGLTFDTCSKVMN